MTNDTKVAELLDEWKRDVDEDEANKQPTATQRAMIRQLEAALARQEADKTAASVITLTDAPTAPPAAQAVDLEQFRRLAESWRHGWGAQGTPTEIAGECADELIELIDQQAGKGVSDAQP